MKEEDRIKQIKEEMAKTQYNKATEHHIGLLKAKIAKLEKVAEVKRKKKAGYGYSIKKTGDATVGLMGFPSSGKSTLLCLITNKESKVAPYAFTTTTVIPGILEIEGLKIQVLDLPGILEGASEGLGAGKEVLSVVRSVDLIVFVIDSTQVEQLDKLKKELYGAGVRLDLRPPDITFKKSSSGKGGVHITSTIKLTKINEEQIKRMLGYYGFINGEVTIREDVDENGFEDGLAGNRIYVPSLIVFNKCDLANPQKIPNSIATCGLTGEGSEELKKRIHEKLSLIRIYTKPRIGEVDFGKPLVMKRGATVADVCRKLHKDFVKYFRYAQVKGKSARFDWQKVGLGHRLEDGDVVNLAVK